jgi:Uma2 family endonuclease
MEARDLRKMSVSEYVELDRSSDERWEYVNGEAWAVSSARPEHNLVSGNVYVALRSALRGKPCLPFPEGQKISTPATRSYHYPDASVVCGPLTRDEHDAHSITNPVVIVEVLSRSTADYDRGGKLVHYRTLATLAEYVLVDVEARVVEHHRRLEPRKWLVTELHEGHLELPSIEVAVPLEELWVDLERLG